uniref:Uncharacterized protein n=1 Tax=Anopheles christyi TaxID=43041 RepID=A0A182KI46_9DIPT
MVFETAGRLTSCQIPQSKGFVPRSGQSVVAVGRQHYVRDEVRVSVQTLLRDTVAQFIAGQFPHDKRLITRRRQDHIRILRIGGDLRHPSRVAKQLAAQL